MVRTAAEKTASTTRNAPAVGSCHRGRDKHRQVGDFQSACRRERQRRDAAGLGHEASGVPRSGRIGRSGPVGETFPAVRAAALAFGGRCARGIRGEPALLAARQAHAAAAVGARRARRRFRRAGQLGPRQGGAPSGRRADGDPHPAKIQRRGGQAILPRGGGSRQAVHRVVQPMRSRGGPRLLAPLAGHFSRGNRRSAGVGLCGSARPLRGGGASAADL